MKWKKEKKKLEEDTEKFEEKYWVTFQDYEKYKEGQTTGQTTTIGSQPGNTTTVIPGTVGTSGTAHAQQGAMYTQQQLHQQPTATNQPTQTVAQPQDGIQVVYMQEPVQTQVQQPVHQQVQYVQQPQQYQNQQPVQIVYVASNPPQQPVYVQQQPTQVHVQHPQTQQAQQSNRTTLQ